MADNAPTPILVAYVSEAEDLLREAIGENFHEVLIVGLRDQRVHVKHSCSLSRVRTLGYLEIARDNILRGMKDD